MQMATVLYGFSSILFYSLLYLIRHLQDAWGPKTIKDNKLHFLLENQVASPQLQINKFKYIVGFPESSYGKYIYIYRLRRVAQYRLFYIITCPSSQ